MISLATFLNAVKTNAKRVKQYQLGRDGSGGKCDCVGLIIGALRLCGVKYDHTHGSNYFARYYTEELHRVTRATDLQTGQLVYKAHEPGETGYDAGIVQKRYGKSGDLRDYYHIGVVTCTQPLCITHCSTGGMHYDTRIGKWQYAGWCKGVEDMIDDKPVIDTGKAVVDTPNDGTLNVRADPRLNGRVMLRIREGQEVEVVETDGEWARVSFPVGWVQSKFLKVRG